MLLEFRLRNYRSFRDEVALSLVASSDQSLAASNTSALDIPSLPRAVRGSVLYGANASGKSNLLRALFMMRAFVVESFSLQPGQPLSVQPFRLDEASARGPTLFEATITINGIRYQYGFEMTSERVMGEWLLVYQTSKPQRWFERYYDVDSGADVINTGSHLSGQKRVWQEATRANALFLSTAVQLNSEQLRPLFNWFADSLVVLLDGGLIPPDYSTNAVLDTRGNETIVRLMSSADVAISSITAVRQKGLQHRITFDAATGKSDARAEEHELLMPRFTHQAGAVTAEFDFADESLGTQKLFALSGPLLDIIEKGKVLIIDELDRSLHPLLTRQIIKIFHDSEVNSKGAQLIFSTHDTSLLDSSFFRRDQIWLTEKHADQSSGLEPLSDFSPRKGEALEKNYLGGRYGGIPILGESLVSRRGHGAR